MRLPEFFHRFGGRNLVHNDLPDITPQIEESRRLRREASARLKMVQVEIDAIARRRVPFDKIG